MKARWPMVPSRRWVAFFSLQLLPVMCLAQVAYQKPPPEVLDVLNAEQTYLNAQVNLATTRRNVIVNDYTVLQAIGRLNVQELAAAGSVYDVEQHYFEVRRKWWGVDITHASGRHELLDLFHSHGEQHESMK